MKSIITIAILLLSLSLVSSAADVYKCASDLKLDTCYLKQESGTEDDSFTTYYVDGCPKGKSCESSIYPYGISMCKT